MFLGGAFIQSSFYIDSRPFKGQASQKGTPKNGFLPGAEKSGVLLCYFV